MHPDCPELARFVRGEIAPSAFPHRDHVRMAFEMLRRHDFAETVLHFSRALRAMAAKAGKAQAFQSDGHDRLSVPRRGIHGAWRSDGFCRVGARSPPERLASEAARRTFLLPDRAIRD